MNIKLEHLSKQFLTVRMSGGLGNQMFQLAALHHISKKTGRTRFIEHTYNPSPHTKSWYFGSIFSSMNGDYMEVSHCEDVHEPSNEYKNVIPLLAQTDCARLCGYFQNYKYVDEDFMSKLTFDKSIVTKYPDIQERIFIHIRGSDFIHGIGSALHFMNLDAYYKRAILLFPNARFVVFTDDKQYAISRPWLQGFEYTLIDEKEIDSLYLMTQCAGGICANSTFSWWGAFLNRNRKLVLPDKMYNDIGLNIYQEGYYFPGCIKCPTSEPSMEVEPDVSQPSDA